MVATFQGGCPVTMSTRSTPLAEQGDSQACCSLISGVAKVPVGYERIRVLYEEYIHLSWLKQVWEKPLTDKPVLEPCFAAAFHGLELCFLLLAEFICDDRAYVAKRPRVEAVATNIRTQCQLLSAIVDGELEEEDGVGRLTLTQDFPFEGCPPTTRGAASSPGLTRLVAAVRKVLPGMKTAERNSLVKVILNIVSAFTASFQRWTVGLGIEPQLAELLACLPRDQTGGTALPYPKPANLDYHLLVRPELVERTLTDEVYTNREDFFFRTVHLITESWVFIASNRIRSSQDLVMQRKWFTAAARITQAAQILHYLGDHILMLTHLNTRDYNELKVEIEGTSGAGSAQVKAIRPLTKQLLQPLTDAACDAAHMPPAADGDDAAAKDALVHVYQHPDKYPDLYNYAKALEDIETALIGGFYFKHYCLAANVLGSHSHGTMNGSVMGLKSTFQTLIFPLLDEVRCELVRLADEEFADNRGRLMDVMLQRVLSGGHAVAVLQAGISMLVVKPMSLTP